MVSGAASWPGSVTRPLTGPEAQPRSTPAANKLITARPTFRHIISFPPRRRLTMSTA
jgi:hypothetical protein